MNNSIVLAITGASAIQIGERSLELLLNNNKEIHLILSKGAYEVAKSERNLHIPVQPESQERYWRERFNTTRGILKCHRWNDLSASIASGSYRTRGMVIVPCTMGTIGRIASGVSINLIERCSDVHLKEKRPLIISPRESPLNLVHLENMKKLHMAGALIAPPIPSWYSKPKDIEEMLDFIVVRLFDTLGEDLKPIRRWKGNGQ